MYVEMREMEEVYASFGRVCVEFSQHVENYLGNSLKNLPDDMKKLHKRGPILDSS